MTDQEESYRVLAEFPFDSTRKRMSLIVRAGSKILLMSKGADSIMLPRCSFPTAQAQEVELSITQELLDFAKEGLRTLIVAQKELTEDEYNSYHE
jgi:magnesium-transporting ATPase (P-type)